jgi:UPF0755 protein
MFKKFLFLLVAAALLFGAYVGREVFTPQSEEAKLVYFSVVAGQSAEAIANNLKQQNLIRSPLVFKIYASLIGAQTKFLVGEHRLSADMNIKEMIKIMTDGSALHQEKKITIIEGWNLKDVANYLEKQHLVSREEFLAAVKTDNWRSQYEFLREVKADDLEGFLFPDTYRVFAKTTAQEIIKKLLDNFDHKLSPEMKEELQKQNKNIFEIIILASIIEREVLSDEDKRLAADVFWKRLALGMGLQSDATINFITGKKDIRPSAIDLQVDSPYNTYKYRGLPPGPIGNPGFKAIAAALYPKHNDYYFFLTDKDGRTIFAKTYQQHQENIKKYLE